MQSIHQHDLVAYLRARISPFDEPQFLFVGANDGFSDDTQTDGLDFVHAFLFNSPWWSATLVEPIPSVFNRLKHNYRNHQNRFTFLNVAVSNEHGNQYLNIYGRDGKASSLEYDEFEQANHTGYSMSEQEKFRILSGTPESGKINVLTLPYEEILQICGLKNFDFIKIDAEGKDSEIVLQILRTSRLTGNYPACIYFEEHMQDKALVAELFNNKYITFPSGLTKDGTFIDRCAIRRDILRTGALSPKFIL